MDRDEARDWFEQHRDYRVTLSFYGMSESVSLGRLFEVFAKTLRVDDAEVPGETK